jgi:hypothetical protein
MDRCYVFRFILDTLAGQHFREVDPETPLAEAAQIQRIYEEREVAYPAHTCVDQPILPCPACLKWTGHGFATVRSNPQCFPGIALQPVLENDVTSVMATCAKTKINRPQQGNSYVDRRRQDMRQLPSSCEPTPTIDSHPHEPAKSINARVTQFWLSNAMIP